MALASENLLAEYLTGVPANTESIVWWQRPFLKRAMRTYEIPLDPLLVRHSFVSPLSRKSASRILSCAGAVDWAHRGDAWFDRIAAKRVATLLPEVVVCYENAALETFRVARKCGIVTVLDAASVHHRCQDTHYQYVESDRVHQRIVARKDEELELADIVLTISEFARDSYLQNGVGAHRLVHLPLGVECSLFRILTTKKTSGPLRLVFTGNLTKLKGLDILLDAVESINAHELEVELTVIGGGQNFEVQRGHKFKPKFIGRLSHSELANELPQHDVFVLPSRFDSFGLVVAEAMACGLPAIVTENVGAKDLVQPTVNGLITPVADVDALASAIRWFIDNRERLPEMSLAARRTTEQNDWTKYRAKAVQLFSQILQTPNIRQFGIEQN